MNHHAAIRGCAVDRYFLGEMPKAEKDYYEIHYFGCSICAREVILVSDFMESLRALFALSP
jgi:hypothetical protein